LPHDHISRLTLPAVVSVEGRLLDEPVRWATDRTRLLLEVEAYQDGPDRRPARGRAQLTIYGETEPLGEGQRIRAEVRLHHPVGFRNPNVFDYPAHLRRDGILLVGSGRGDRVTPLTVDAPPWPIRVRRWAVATIRAQLPESSAALLAGLLLGERTALPGETDEAFRRAGVYHVLAVSGFNVALVASSVFAAPSTGFLKERGWPHWLAAAVAVSLAAQLPVTPIMLAHFNQLSLIGVAANLLVVPLAGPTTTLGMLALLTQVASETAASLLFN